MGPDLDGVVWLAGAPIPGSPGAIRRLRDAGNAVVFLTNNSGPTVAEHVAALVAAGVEASGSDLVTSAQAAASMLASGSSATVVGGPGVTEAVVGRGVIIVDAGASPDAVVLGRTVELDYDQLAAAATAVRHGARLVATNTDATYPTAKGLLPGAGAIVAFVEVAAGRKAEVAGKPHRAVADLVRARFGTPTVMIGDRADTDGAFARAVGAPFGLVLSGVTRREDLPLDPAPAVIGADLAEVVDSLLADRPG